MLSDLAFSAQSLNRTIVISVLMEGLNNQSVPELKATAVADVSVTGAAAPWILFFLSYLITWLFLFLVLQKYLDPQ